MDTLSNLAGHAAILTGATSIYLGSPNRPVAAPPRVRIRLRRLGWAMLTVALPLLSRRFAAPTAVFIVITFAILAWSILPLAENWWIGRRAGPR